jgi:adenylate cyclase
MERSERRLSAILSADVVGYTRLMAADEDETVRRVTAYREQVGSLVRDHRGRLADFTGDNFLAEFPTALDAVECAIEIQRVLSARNAALPADRRMEFRIGVHLGDVRVEGERVYGEGVNIAARLESMAEPGGVCISATVHEQVRNRLEVGFDDLGDRAVKNVPEQIHVYKVQVNGAGGPEPQASRRLPVRWLALAGVVALALVVWAFWPRVLGRGLELVGIGAVQSPALPDRPSIVVLPFDNMSGDPEQEYFSDGLTEDLTAALAGTSSLFVISRNSAFTYKNQAVKVEDVGRELGVRYVLEGSVRRVGDRVRITAQLIDATSGFHVWSERYDRELDDVFAVQSEISERILGAVGVTIRDDELERIRRTPTGSMTAYDAVQRGSYHFALFRRHEMLEARRWFERAVELDPDYAAAHSLLGSTYSASYGLFWTLDPAALERARALAEHALSLDPGIPLPRITLTVVALNEKDWPRALSLARGAIEVAPNDATGYFFLAAALSQTEDQMAALEAVQRGLRLNPRVSSVGPASALMAGIYRNTGRVDEAVQLWRRARNENPDLIMARLNLAAWHASQERLAEARVLVEEALAVNPNLTRVALASQGIVTRAFDDAFMQNLEQAGLP